MDYPPLTTDHIKNVEKVDIREVQDDLILIRFWIDGRKYAFKCSTEDFESLEQERGGLIGTRRLMNM